MHHPCTDAMTAQLARCPKPKSDPTKPIGIWTTWYCCPLFILPQLGRFLKIITPLPTSDMLRDSRVSIDIITNCDFSGCLCQNRSQESETAARHLSFPGREGHGRLHYWTKVRQAWYSRFKHIGTDLWQLQSSSRKYARSSQQRSLCFNVR